MSDEAVYMPRDDRKKRNRVVFGVILILLGGVFLLQQYTNFEFRNWWALFILIPAFGAFTSAVVLWQQSGRFTEGVRGSIGSGLMTLTVAVIFLLNLNWGVWWPLMVIMFGFTLLLSGFPTPGSREAERPLSRRLYRPWLGWTGLGAMVLGAGFLSANLGYYNPALLTLNWWAVPILIPALGGVLTALRLLFSGEGLGWASISNLVTTAIFAVVGLVALSGISWSLLTPIIIIAVGLILLVGAFRR